MTWSSASSCWSGTRSGMSAPAVTVVEEHGNWFCPPPSPPATVATRSAADAVRRAAISPMIPRAVIEALLRFARLLDEDEYLSRQTRCQRPGSSHVQLVSLSGAAPESNRPSRGLHDRTGFEDQLGHRARAAPPRTLAQS